MEGKVFQQRHGSFWSGLSKAVFSPLITSSGTPSLPGAWPEARVDGLAYLPQTVCQAQPYLS